MSNQQTHEDCGMSGGQCSAHALLDANLQVNDKRIDALELIVKDIPRMQARVHMLMYILIASMTVLISVSCFSFLQLVDFKKTYFTDRQQHQQTHANDSLEQEKRYVDLINKLGQRVGILEARFLFAPNIKK